MTKLSLAKASRMMGVMMTQPEKPSRKKTPVEGPWEMSGPEEGDGDDTVLVCNNDADDYEVIEITAGTLAKRKRIARKIAELLNEGEGILL